MKFFILITSEMFVETLLIVAEIWYKDMCYLLLIAIRVL